MTASLAIIPAREGLFTRFGGDGDDERQPAERHNDPEEQARLARSVIQASAWSLLERDQVRRETARIAHLHIAASALGGMSVAQRLGLDTRSPLQKAQADELRELNRLSRERADALKDFLLNLKILMPLDPVFRGIETCDDPIERVIDRAREWIAPVPQDAYQLDADIEAS